MLGCLHGVEFCFVIFLLSEHLPKPIFFYFGSVIEKRFIDRAFGFFVRVQFWNFCSVFIFLFCGIHYNFGHGALFASTSWLHHQALSYRKRCNQFKIIMIQFRLSLEYWKSQFWMFVYTVQLAVQCAVAASRNNMMITYFGQLNILSMNKLLWCRAYIEAG